MQNLVVILIDSYEELLCKEIVLCVCIINTCVLAQGVIMKGDCTMCVINTSVSVRGNYYARRFDNVYHERPLCRHLFTSPHLVQQMQQMQLFILKDALD